MILTLDIGNSQIFGGVFRAGELLLRFRKNSRTNSSSDEIGVFLRSVLRENDLDPNEVKQIALCSVVPDVVYSIKNACRKYFKIVPFVLQAGVKTGLKICYHNPVEVGADRIANSIAAVDLYPQKNLIVIDLGTATTFCAITDKRDYLGGVIMPGLRLCMESLETGTAKLPVVEIIRRQETLGKNTVESIQSGLYFGHLGAMKEVIERLSVENFNGAKPFLVGTGGFCHLFEIEHVFDVVNPDLVLLGLVRALDLNQKKIKGVDPRGHLDA